MISRVYCVVDNEIHGYKGFDRYLENAPYLAAFKDEYQWEVFALDNMDSITEFKRFITIEYPHLKHAPQINVFKNTILL